MFCVATSNSVRAEGLNNTFKFLTFFRSHCSLCWQWFSCVHRPETDHYVFDLKWNSALCTNNCKQHTWRIIAIVVFHIGSRLTSLLGKFTLPIYHNKIIAFGNTKYSWLYSEFFWMEMDNWGYLYITSFLSNVVRCPILSNDGGCNIYSY